MSLSFPCKWQLWPNLDLWPVSPVGIIPVLHPGHPGFSCNICYFSSCEQKLKQLQAGKVYFGSQFESPDRRTGAVWQQKHEAVGSIISTRGQRSQEVGPGYKSSRTPPGDGLPSVKLLTSSTKALSFKGFITFQNSTASCTTSLQTQDPTIGVFLLQTINLSEDVELM